MKLWQLISVLFFSTVAMAQEPAASKYETPQDYKAYAKTFVEKKVKSFSKCNIEAEKKSGKKLKGMMKLFWEVTIDGKAQDFSRGTDNVDIPELYHCYEKTIAKWKFEVPPLDRKIELEHEFIFGAVPIKSK
jgi:hypothetical protein